MRSTNVSRARKGFTLVEILIVVVILGILAAIVIPQFTEAASDAEESSAKSTLQTVRAQFELCKFRGDCDCNPADVPTLFTAMVDNGYLQSTPTLPEQYDWGLDAVGDCQRIVVVDDAGAQLPW